MKLSVITPHFNDFKGIQRVYECLKKQTSSNWEWIIVDDYSDTPVRQLLKDYFREKSSENIKLVFNDSKTNASVCRNVGVEESNYDKLVFLDSDDIILEDFISNRLVEINDFVVFRNFNTINNKGETKLFSTVSSDFLNHFLQAKFIWQTTAVLWNKEFFVKIGKFNPDLNLLEDIELSIRGLMLSTNYKVLDNKVDFLYSVSPINTKKRSVDSLCSAVNYLIGYMHDSCQLNKRQRDLVTGYYYLCVRYFNRSTTKGDIVYVQNSLTEFYKKKYMSYLSYLRALSFIKLYKMNLISSDLFLRLNRRFYK
ncbi:glycosyltransferase involved in cell wall biosynthesis [Winogradskyella wandonensis]|uniref:Glycosyltransferase involved in cell wall biosynthesis n=1 Tax=Winogradskyella wandonensis TaxID=1442586 RepID=A0A4R1KWV6_9FLAO|nr:glycosyltransferase family 2 protein [Winogradskyella wandonensis]TCK68829.1 glycosyltransferase involved in cell wall biosynthesis [Winogradskyella wandonensis]